MSHSSFEKNKKMNFRVHLDRAETARRQFDRCAMQWEDERSTFVRELCRKEMEHQAELKR